METKKNKTIEKKEKILAVIRIEGMVKVRKDVAETLDRLRLRRKYACVLVDSNNEGKMGMLKKVKHFVAYGEIDDKTLKELIDSRGSSIEGKIDSDKIVKGLLGGKKLKDLGLKPFFRLHPPRKGIKSKLQFPKGVLGNNGVKINDLIRRML